LKGLGASDGLFSPEAIASGEEIKKIATKMGYDLARSAVTGGREAGFIIQGAIGTIPSGDNSPLGARRLLAGIDAASQRQIDLFNFVTAWNKRTNGSVAGAEDAFNQMKPPEAYAKEAIVSTIPPAYADRLRQLGNDPNAIAKFDQRFGVGTARLVLGQ
jgi:hypothetical protein